MLQTEDQNVTTDLEFFFLGAGDDASELLDQFVYALRLLLFMHLCTHLLCKNPTNSNLIDVARLLIDQGAEIDAIDSYGLTALYLLCGNPTLYERLTLPAANLAEIARLLTDHGALVNAKGLGGRTALHRLCENYCNANLVDISRLFIDQGADANAKNSYGWTVLHCLCQNPNNVNLVPLLRLLIDQGAEVNAKDSSGRTALYFLCENTTRANLFDVARLLIDHGADSNDDKDENSSTSLDVLGKFYPDGEIKKKLIELLSGRPINRS